ncbi:MAG: hypothetical protein ILP10_08890 [Lachnospiraceae bacterium]|nr:hypothetical protein [Lachnospiraceae bacterium]
MTIGYLITEAALYVAFLALDLAGGMSHIADPLKMASISLVFVFVLGRLIGEKRKAGRAANEARSAVADRAFLCGAFFFAVIADIFLLFGGDTVAGVLCFCAVQTIHLARMTDLKKGAVRLCFRLSLAGLLFALLSTLLSYRGTDLFVVIFYAISFADNLFVSAGLCRMLRRGGEGKLLAGAGFPAALRLFAGLALFFMCDICVALYNAPSFAEGALPDGLAAWLLAARPVTGILMWFFYLPGQVLISLS